MAGRPLRGSTLALLLLAAACDEGPRDLYFGIGGGRLHAVVTGRVVDPGEAPVAAAVVATRLYDDPGCLGGSPGDLSPATTNTEGRFTVRADIPFSDPFEGCVVIRVTPPSRAGVLPDSVQAELELRREEPYDSIFVEIRLPAPMATAPGR